MFYEKSEPTISEASIFILGYAMFVALSFCGAHFSRPFVRNLERELSSPRAGTIFDSDTFGIFLRHLMTKLVMMVILSRHRVFVSVSPLRAKNENARGKLRSVRTLKLQPRTLKLSFLDRLDGIFPINRRHTFSKVAFCSLRGNLCTFLGRIFTTRRHRRIL